MKKMITVLLLLALTNCDHNDVKDIANSAPKAVSTGLDILQQQADAVAPALRNLKEDQLDALYKVEYLVRDLPLDASVRQIEAELNTIGSDGWECFSVLRNESSATTRYSFKRRTKSFLPFLFRLMNQ